MPKLCIRRNEGERVFIGENISVMVKQCRNGHCRLCIDAPQSVNIRREELEIRERADVRDKVASGKDQD
jgi:carbon storage regulator CsrA